MKATGCQGSRVGQRRQDDHCRRLPYLSCGVYLSSPAGPLPRRWRSGQGAQRRVLCQLYGYDHTGNAWAYIAGYNKDPLRAIYKALATVEKILDLLYGQPQD